MNKTFFKKIHVELIESGFTDLEAMGIATMLSMIPDMKRLWGMPDAKKIITSVIYDGVEPMTNHQQALIDGTLNLTDKQRRYYYEYTFEDISMSRIGQQEGIHFETVRNHIEIAKGKLAAAKNGELDWEDNPLVKKALAEMPHRTRSYFELRYFEGLTIDETAERLGVSHWTVRRMIRKVKNEIHGKLARTS